MFYLLEDNTIIDANDLLKNSDIQINIKKIQEYKVLYLIGWFGERSFGTIEKQSENVYDLIEVGDLLKIKYEGRIELCDFQDNEVNYANYLKNYYPNDLLAIYKPNKKGDYIKVWERK